MQQEYKGKLPDDAWEAHMRKALNDAAWQNLAYVPYCPHAPCCRPKCEQPSYAWVSNHSSCIKHFIQTNRALCASAGLMPGANPRSHPLFEPRTTLCLDAAETQMTQSQVPEVDMMSSSERS